MSIAFRAQSEAFLGRLSKISSQWPETGTVTEADAGAPDWEGEFDDAAEETVRSRETAQPMPSATGLLAGAQTAIADFKTGISFDLANPRAVAI